MRRILILGLVSVYAAAFVPARAITLTDANSTVTIDEFSSSGMTSWVVDGIDHMFQQWYWKRVGSTGPEVSIDTISAPVVVMPAANQATITYTAAGVFTLDLSFFLRGGSAGSGASDISEVVRVVNTSGSPLSFHIFEYSDFDMEGTASGDFASLENSSTIKQYESVAFALVGVVPIPSHFEIGAFPSILGKLTDGDADDLSDSGSPFGPGDATFAFQWDVTIAPRENFILSKNKIINVPEPGSMIALGSLVGLLALRRKRK